jgi:hypothetical protein
VILDVDGFSDELLGFIEGRTRDRPEFIEANPRKERRGFWGRIVIRPKGRRLPIESDTFSILRDMLERHADIEIADELSVHDADGCLVSRPTPATTTSGSAAGCRSIRSRRYAPRLVTAFGRRSPEP